MKRRTINIPGLQPDGSPYPPITVKQWSFTSTGVLKNEMEYMQTAVGRDNWTCEIPAKDVAAYVTNHIKFWEVEIEKATSYVVKEASVKQVHFWETWQDFLLTIEPTVKLRFTIEDYKFFYFGVGKAREVE